MRRGRVWRMAPGQNRSVFVTGATGLLGSWLVEELLAARRATWSCWCATGCPAAEFVAGPRPPAQAVVVRRRARGLRARSCARLNEYEIDSVFHLGAQTIVGVASRHPLSTFESNIRGTWNLLEACAHVRASASSAWSWPSSDKAYGEHEKLPYTEDAPLQGRFPYDVSKSCADLIAL